MQEFTNFLVLILLLTFLTQLTPFLEIPGAECYPQQKNIQVNSTDNFESASTLTSNESENFTEFKTRTILSESGQNSDPDESLNSDESEADGERESRARKHGAKNKRVKQPQTTTPANVRKIKVENFRNEDKIARLKALLDTLLENYDKRIRPGYFDQGPTQVGVNVLVKNIASINEVDMDFQIDFYLRQTWTDSRLAFRHLKVKNSTDNSSGEDNADADDLDILGLTHEFLDRIWIPDTFFRNEKSSKIHDSTVPNKFVRLYPDGRIKTSTRLTVTASCNLNLINYPMDSQICGLNLGSYGYSTAAIQYNWLTVSSSKERNGIGQDAVKIDLQSSFLPQFRVKGHRTSQNVTITSTGEYSSLSFEFLFVRSLDFYLSRVYAPAILVVVIAYFALWMGRESNSLLSRARPGLGITSVLTITTIYLSTNTNTAHINYLKALDIYLGLCFLGVFTTLLQTCFVIYLSKRIAAYQKRQEAKKSQSKSTRNANPNNLNIVQNGQSPVNVTGNGPVKEVDVESQGQSQGAKAKVVSPNFWPSKIDLVCRALFPLIFIVLNTIYWTHFLNASKEAEGCQWIFAKEE